MTLSLSLLLLLLLSLLLNSDLHIWFVNLLTIQRLAVMQQVK